MRNVFWIFGASLLFICNNANADQCAYIDKNTRDNAYNILKSTDTYIDFCAPCQDIEPIEKKINKVEYKKVDYIKNNIQFYQIYINDEPIDIAYIYVGGRNLGVAANCEPFVGQQVQNVPEYIADYLSGKWTLPPEREPE